MWTKLTAAASYSPRPAVMVSSSSDYLYLVTGSGDAPANAVNDLWMSADSGNTWIPASLNDAYSARSGSCLVAIGRQLVLFGGVTSSGSVLNVGYSVKHPIKPA